MKAQGVTIPMGELHPFRNHPFQVGKIEYII